MRHLYLHISNAAKCRCAEGAEHASESVKTANANAPVMRDINLKIPAGSTLAIVGPTGSGKSTLAILIARIVGSAAKALC